jgi:hypothetical protein
VVVPGHSRGIVATAGLVQDYQNANALRLAEAGWVVLTLEVRGFGYLQRLGRGDPALDKGPFMGLSLVRGTTPLGITVRDAAAGLRYLATRPEVDPERLGAVGFSSGCDAAIYLAALEPRVAALVASSCLSSHDANFRFSLNDPYEAIPGIALWLEMSDCLGLVAPRPALVQWGERDADPRSRSAALNPSALPIFDAAKRIYAGAGAADRLERRISPGLAHEFDVAAARDFLARWLPVP